jgi:type I restriction enzyme S subunit
MTAKPTFHKVLMGDVARIQSGYSFSSSDWQESGIGVVKIANLKNGHLVREGLGYVSQEVASAANNFALVEGDILLGMTGYVGEVVRVRPWDLPLLLNQRVGRCTVTNVEILDHNYLYHYLRLETTRELLESLAHGTAQPNLSSSDFNCMELYLPDLSHQRRIAAVLGAIDDKIAWSRKTIGTMDQLVATLSEGLMDGDLDVPNAMQIFGGV